MAYEHITAKWAREQTDGKLVQQELNECFTKIEKAVVANEDSTYASGSLHELTKRELMKRGFKVTYNAGDPRDQRESSTHTISW